MCAFGQLTYQYRNPSLRPSFVQIVNKFDDLIVDSALDDQVGRQMWKMCFKGEVRVHFAFQSNFVKQDAVGWKEFTHGFFEFLKVKQHRDPALVKCLHDVVGM